MFLFYRFLVLVFLIFSAVALFLTFPDEIKFFSFELNQKGTLSAFWISFPSFIVANLPKTSLLSKTETESQ